MNTELEEFIYSCCEFNDCTFCKKFGLTNSCPIKDAYKNDEANPSRETIEKNGELCKNYVVQSLKNLLLKD